MSNELKQPLNDEALDAVTGGGKKMHVKITEKATGEIVTEGTITISGKKK